MEDRGDVRLALAPKELAGLVGRQSDDFYAAAAGFGVDIVHHWQLAGDVCLNDQARRRPGNRFVDRQRRVTKPSLKPLRRAFLALPNLAALNDDVVGEPC